MKPAMKIDAIMSESPACCTRDDFVQVAASIMERFDTGIVPVTETVAYPAKLVGVVTDRDLCLRVLGAGRDPNQVRVGEVMSTKLATCKPSDSVEQVLLRMGSAQVRRLPVVNSDFQVVGLISFGDIVRHKAAGEAGFLNTMRAIYAPAKVARAKTKKAA
jgi:CBS domain-containing protein